MTDVFGDLKQWGDVINQMDELRLAARLDQHQVGLARILRYRYNWQLREAALRAALHLKAPSKEVLEALLTIVADDLCDMETRLLACHAVRHALNRYRQSDAASGFSTDVAQFAAEMLHTPQPPVLRAAIEQWSVTECAQALASDGSPEK
jgi:hypothetical protein